MRMCKLMLRHILDTNLSKNIAKIPIFGFLTHIAHRGQISIQLQLREFQYSQLIHLPE